MSHISLSLQHGQSLGIIGPTGAGKSTLVQLLLRLYDLDSGEIRIDGRNITTFPLKELRQKFGVVFQNDTLFKETLLENIDMGRKLSMDAIKEAAHTAQAEGIYRSRRRIRYPDRRQGREPKRRPEAAGF